MKAEMINMIKNRTSVIGIIGMGYVGLPLAREFLKSNFEVIGFDIDNRKVQKINDGDCYIDHIGSEFLQEYVITKKKFSATTDYTLLKKVDIILICVPTPLGKHNDPNLSFVMDTSYKIIENLKKGQAIILESTTYPGTTEEEMLPLFQSRGFKVGKDFFLGYSPEREDPGNRNFTTGTIPKVVSGVTKDCLAIIDSLYKQIVIQTVPVSSPKIAEASKILENSYRAVNIALVNELKMVFDRMDIDVWEVINAAKSKPFGFQPFYPGPGLGGHCIPIDPFYLTWKAKEFGLHTRFIELAGEINSNMPYYVVQKVIAAVNSIGKSIVMSKILLVGLAYKPDVDDMRESPSLKIMDVLFGEKAEVDYYDPFISHLTQTREYNFSLKSIDPTKINDNFYDVIVIITDHSNIDFETIVKKGKTIIDTRDVLNRMGIKAEKIWKA